MGWGFGDQDQVSIKWALAICRHVGFKSRKLLKAVAVMTAESNRYPGAWHENTDVDGHVTSTDRGAFQINDRWHPDLPDEDAYRVIPNARYAYELSNHGEHWSHWAAYGGTRYTLALAQVIAVWALGTWKLRVPRVEREYG